MKHKLSFGIAGVYPAREIQKIAAMAEEIGLESFWISEDYFEAGIFSLACSCAMVTKSINIGIGVINPYTRHPALSAMEAVTLDEISDGRLILGLGAGNKRCMEVLAGIPFVKPITATKECTQILKGLFRGEEVEMRGEYFKTGKVKLRNRVLRPNQPVYLGVKGDNALRVAGAEADGVLLSAGSPIAYVKYAREKIAEGAKAAGRDPSDIKIAAYLPTCMDTDEAVAQEKAIPVAIRYMGVHGPNPILTTSGIDVALLRHYHEAFMAGETPTIPLTSEIVNTIVVAGTPAQCRQRVEAYIDAGVDMPIITSREGLTPFQCLEDIKRYMLD